MFLKKTLLPILLATIWISFSEFARNQFLLKTFWVEHYQHMGLKFPSASMNGVIWGVWFLLFAVTIYIINRKFTLNETFLISWFMVFVLMWLVIGNLNVLPYGILIYAIPLSLLETFIASYIIKKLS